MISKTVYNIEKLEFDGEIQSEFYLPLLLCINRSITKKFLIKILSEMIDSTCPRLLMLESVLFETGLIGNFFGMDRF